MKVARGTGLRTYRVITRFAPLERPGRRPGSSVLDDRIAELRRLLRTDMPVRLIAAELGVKKGAIETFCRRRHICDLAARRIFINLKKSTSGEPIA